MGQKAHPIFNRVIIVEKDQMENNEQPHDIAEIRGKLNTAFDDVQLDAFCLDYYPEVYDAFGKGMGKGEKITRLLDHVRRREEFETLLSAVENAQSKRSRVVLRGKEQYRFGGKHYLGMMGILAATFTLVLAIVWVATPTPTLTTIPAPTLTPTPVLARKSQSTPTPTLTTIPTPTLTPTPVLTRKSQSTHTPTPGTATPASKTDQVLSQNIEFVDHIGGASLDVAIQDDYAYIGEGPRLTILDISDPSNPTVAGKTLPMPGVVQTISVFQNHVFVADAGGGLRVINVSNPGNPTEVRFLESIQVNDMVVVENYLYIGGNDGFRIMSVSDPTNPTEVWSYTYDADDHKLNHVQSVAVDGHYVYVGEAYSWRVLDISDPANPTEISINDESLKVISVVARGDYAYVVTGSGQTLKVMDISDPTNPTQVSYHSSKSLIKSVAAVSDDYVYLILVNGDVSVVDVSNILDPYLADTYSAGYSAHACDMVIKENYAYIADCNGGLVVMDTSDTTQIGLYNSPSARAVTARENYLYVTKMYSLLVMDVSDPDDPKVVGFCDTVYSPEDMVTTENYAYIVGGARPYNSRDSLDIVDISNPSNPARMRSFSRLDLGGLSNDLAISGHYIYVALHANTIGIYVIDISDPNAPIKVTLYDVPKAESKGIAISGNYAYVADRGLRVLDISDPVPIEVGFNSAPKPAKEVLVNESYAYVHGGSHALMVFDISDPSTPVMVGRYEKQIYALKAISENCVYASGEFGFKGTYINSGEDLIVLDVSDPTNPIEVGHYSLGFPILDVAVSGDYVYVATGNGGLFILSTRNR